MSDQNLTPNFRRRNFASSAATSMSLQSTATEEDEQLRFLEDRFDGAAVMMMMQSSFDLPFGDSGTRGLLQEDELATTRMMSVDEPDVEGEDEEEALDNFEMETPNESRNDLEILSPIKLSMLSTQLLSTKTAVAAERTKSALSGGGLMGNNVSSLKCTQRGGMGGSLDRRTDDGPVCVGRPRKVVEFANFEDSDSKHKRTDSTGGGGTDAAIQAKIFAEIRK